MGWFLIGAICVCSFAFGVIVKRNTYDLDMDWEYEDERHL